jgi:mannan endo-1,4-beta-mannosidase
MQLKRFSTLGLFAILACAAWAQTASQPVNAHATPEARALLAYLNSISGKGIVTGQHNYPYTGARWTDMAYDLTGKYPGLYGQDFGFSAGEDKDSVLSRPEMIEEVKRQYQHGSIIALTWHEVRPTDDEPVTFTGSVQAHLTDYEWKELLTPGTPLYNRWCAQVDVVAGYLRQLRDAHVPVLYRPYHEMNGGWFWWGGRPGKDGSAALYRQLYDRFVNVHHLDNLIWVWNVNAPNPGWPPVAEYYPGANYADVVTMDIYGEFKQEFYDSMVAVAGNKPIALAEVGGLPSPEVLEKQPKWTYFMAWSEFIQVGSPLDRTKAVYNSPRAISRDDARLALPMDEIRKATAQRGEGAPEAEPVSSKSTGAAKALLARLLAAPGKAILSGQLNDASAPAAATAAVFSASGKQPAIYGADLGTSAENQQAIVKEALHAAQNHALISLGWRAPWPTNDAPASAKGQLTDYEWSQLLAPGTALNQHWASQADAVAALLQQLDKAGVAVLWNPYPESNSKDFWWSGRKGVHGSSELYRMLFDRLVNHDSVHNLVWVWETAEPNSRPGAEFLTPTDFFPGLLYVDAVQARLKELSPWVPADRMTKQLASGKPVGVELTGPVPQPEALVRNGIWAWFLATPATDSAGRTDDLRHLYSDPRIDSLPAVQ